MADVFRRYYGEEVASRFSSLMREHLVLAAQLVKDAKAATARQLQRREEVVSQFGRYSAFMSSINPNWPNSVLQNMLYEHLRMTKDEAVFRLTKKYKSDIETLDKIEKQAVEMADVFVNGIV